MLLRFEDDVVALAPVAAVLLAGTNDLRCYVGAATSIRDTAVAGIARNVTAMGDIAAARGIDLLVGTLPPVGAQPDTHRDPGSIAAANAWLAGFARMRGLRLLDYHAALADAAGTLPPALSDDGVHPNAAGYARMLVVLHDALAAIGPDDRQEVTSR